MAGQETVAQISEIPLYCGTFDLIIPQHLIYARTQLLLESFYRTTGGPYNIIVQQEKGTLYQNFNKGVARANSRYLISVDHDIQFLTPNLCRRVLAHVQAHAEVGLASCASVDQWIGTLPEARDTWEEYSWLPGYLWAWDRQRIDVRMDETMPQITGKGMTDVDCSFSARSSGLVCAINRGVVVFHPKYPIPEGWQKEWLMQSEYMLSKWGSQWELGFREGWPNTSYVGVPA